MTLRVFFSRLLRAIGSGHVGDLNAEVDDHLQRLEDEHVREGMSPEEAKRAARREFGGVDQLKEAYRDQRGLLLEGFARDIRIACRTSLKSRAFAPVVIATLALGIGATVAMFAVLNQVLLRPLPYPSADRLVRVQSPVPGIRSDAVWNLSTAEYFYFRDSVHSFEEIGIYVSTSGTLGIVSDVAGSTAERVTTGIVSRETLGLLGARPVLGRLFTENDQHYDLRFDSPPVVILSHEVWQRRFSGRLDIVGRTVTFEDHPFPIVGVLAAGVELPETAFSPTSKVGLWMPLGLDPNAPAVNMHTFRAIARLRPGSTLVGAQRELNVLTAKLPALFPSAYSPAFMADTHFSAAVIPLRDDILGSARQMLWVLAAAIGVVFLIAAVNVANLFLVRTETRRRELSIRLALGASRFHLFRHVFAESALLCAAATAVGLGLASVALRVVILRAATNVPRLSEVHLDKPSVAAAGIAALLLAAGFATFSVIRSDVDEESDLRQQLRTASRRHQRIRSILVTAQVASAVVLVAGAALMARSVQHLLQVRPGFDATGVLTFDLVLPRTRYTSEQGVAAYHRELAAALASDPEVEVVSAATSTPLDGNDGCDAVWVEGHSFASGANPCVDTTRVTPGYFDALRIQVRGRTPDWSMVSADAVVSESLAQRLWPGEDAIGKGIRINGDGPPYYRVIGVATDVRRNGFDKPPAETVYFPVVSRNGAPIRGAPRGMRVVIRTRTTDPAAILAQVRTIVMRIDPNVPIANVQTLSDSVRESMARSSFTATLLATAALLALILSAVGLYGVIAYGVAARQTELGVRLALGARPGILRLMVIRETLFLVVSGLCIGVLVTLASTRFIAGFLYGVSPHDPVTLVSVTVLLLCMGLMAGAIPAWRASRLDPIIALRCE